MKLNSLFDNIKDNFKDNLKDTLIDTFTLANDGVICPNCGRSMKPGAVVCTNCGTKLSGESDESSIPDANFSATDESAQEPSSLDGKSIDELFDMFVPINGESEPAESKSAAKENAFAGSKAQTAPQDESEQEFSSDTAEENLFDMFVPIDEDESADSNTTSTEENSSTADFEKEYASCLTYYTKAKNMIDMDESEFALTSIRKCLEGFIKQICTKCGIENDTRTTTLELMIDSLREHDVVSEYEVSLFHRIRSKSNLGTHVDESGAPDLDVAKDAYDDLTEAIDHFRSILQGEALSGISVSNNKPMENPDYYDPRRRYIGKWSKCYTRQDLMANPEYVSLLKKADGGEPMVDIEAMIDLASGFLPNRDIPWDRNNGLINFPVYRAREFRYNTESCRDIRYYHWIIRAANEAVNRYYFMRSDCRKNFSFKYITTVVLEAKKFWFYTHYSTWYNLVTDVEFYYDPEQRRQIPYPTYKDVWELELEMFGGKNSVDSGIAYTDFLLYLLDEFGSGQIISPVHLESTKKHILFMDYCLRYIFELTKHSPNQRYPIQEPYAISPEDAGLDVTDELLNKYSDDPVCKTYAQIARQYIYSLRHGPKDSRGMLVDRNAKGMDGVKKLFGKIRNK